MISPLNALIAHAVDHPKYKSVSNKKNHQNLSRPLPRSRKKVVVQMRLHGLSDSDPITMLSFLAKFKDACNHKRVPKSIALWRFQLYVEGQA